jgi:toxin FitB
MIILDTNVVSELMKPTPDPAVAAWVDGLERSAIHATSPTVYEIEFGIGRLPDGQRKERLKAAWALILRDFFSG